MLRRISILLAITLALVSSAPAQRLAPPTLTPGPSTEAEERLIREGVELHDQGDYDAAIAKYEDVLKENPDNVLALYEEAYSYSLKNDYQKTLEVAYRGARYKSDNIGGFYLLIGNTLDITGESQKSIEVYKAGIELVPDLSLLYYNLAITYSNIDKLEEAKKNLKKAILLDPDHPSSHRALGSFFSQTGYKVPSMLARLRFLVLEPGSERSATAFKLFLEGFQGNVRQGENPNETFTLLELSGKKDEGDFDAVESAIALGRAAALTDENKGKSEIEKFVDQMKLFFSVFSVVKSKADKSKFVWKYYVPYFLELEKNGYIEPFCYYISQQSDMSGVEEWLNANSDRVAEFLQWSEGYKWPKK